MDPNSQGSDYDWLDRYLWCVAVASRRSLLSAIDAINVLPDPNTHSGIVYVQTEDVMLYFRGWEDWSYDNYGWTRRYRAPTTMTNTGMSEGRVVTTLMGR